jgi:hypothetical protein
MYKLTKERMLTVAQEITSCVSNAKHKFPFQQFKGRHTAYERNKDSDGSWQLHDENYTRRFPLQLHREQTLAIYSWWGRSAI